ncbi:PAS-domain containing protein [Hydrogenophaga soli]
MIVILKVGGLSAAADRIRQTIAQEGLPWRLVHVSTLNQARLALARDTVDLLLIHHQLPDGQALGSELPLANGIIRVLSIELGQEAVAARALEAGFDDYVIEQVGEGFGTVMLAQIRSGLRHRETARHLAEQHEVLGAISRAQAHFIQSTDNRQAFQALLTDLLALTHSAFGFVGEVFYDAPDRPWLQVHALSDTAWDDASRRAHAEAQGSGMPLRNLDTLFGAALRTGEVVLTNRPGADPRSGGHPKGHPALRSFLGLPVGQPGQLLAMVGLANRPGGYSPAHVQWLQPLLDTLGQLVVARRGERDRADVMRKLQATLDAMDQGLLMTDAKGHCVLFNQRVLPLLEVEADFFASQPHRLDLLLFQKARGDFGPDAEWVQDPQLRAFIQNPTPATQIDLPPTFRRTTRHGRVLEVRTWGLPSGEQVSTYTDVTDMHQQQQALVQAHERLAAIVDGTRAGTWEWHIDADEVEVNERFASLVGHRREDLPRKVKDLYAMLLHPADEDRLHEANLRHLRGETDLYECQFRFRHAKGHWIWVLERGRINQRDASGRPTVMSGTTIDITDSKHAEDALRVTSELLRERTKALEATLQAMSKGLLVISPEGRVKLYNQQACVILDMPDSYMATMPLVVDIVQRQMQRGDFGPDFSYVESGARLFVRSVGDPNFTQWPQRYVRRTPQGRYLEIKNDPMPDGGVIRTFADVTPFIEAVESARERGEEIRRLNETLEQRVAQRTLELERSMSDIEALSYSIAHDLRGPLRAVNGFAALIAAEEADRLSPEGREMFARITEASRRMGVMITDLLQLFKVVRADLVPTEVNVAALAQEAVRSLAAAYPRTAIDVEPLPPAQGDAALLRILVSNLIDNALKYSAKADSPRVTVGWNDELHAWFVRDNGVGFDMAHAQKLFGLFQRLHVPADFEGSGLGLAVAARVAERHGGRIWADAHPGQGACFWFTLAAHPALMPEPVPPASPDQPPSVARQPSLFGE